MKKHLFKSLFLFLSMAVTLIGQETKPEWENPEVFGINKLDPHAHFIPFQNQESALSFDVSTSDRYGNSERLLH